MQSSDPNLTQPVTAESAHDAQAAARRLTQSLSRDWLRFGVTKAWLFGSRAAETSAAKSDWDFAVEFAEPPTFDRYMGLKSALEQRLGGPVDLISRAACAPRFWKAIEADLIDVT